MAPKCFETFFSSRSAIPDSPCAEPLRDARPVLEKTSTDIELQGLWSVNDLGGNQRRIPREKTFGMWCNAPNKASSYVSAHIR
jgi:hypothetical protein